MLKISAKISVIASFLILVVFQSVSFSIAQSSTRLQVVEKEIVVSSSIDGTVVSELDLGTLPLGTVNRTIIVLTNRLKDPIEFVEASVGCSCISANVPKTKVLPGGKERLVFDLSVGGSERKTAKDFEIELRTTGAIDRILIKLSAKIGGVVALGVESMLHELCGAEVGKNEAAPKRVQIITSDIALIRDATVAVSDNLQ